MTSVCVGRDQRSAGPPETEHDLLDRHNAGSALRPPHRPAAVGRRQPRRRGAALYVVVLSVAMIVSVLALASLGELHLEREAFEREQDMLIARRYAQAAIEVGMQRIAADPNWRTTYNSGVWEQNQPIGIDGRYTLAGVDPNDGDLTSPDSDPVVLTGTATRGGATQKMEVTLIPDPRGMTCLQVAVHAGTDVNLHDPAGVGGNVVVSSNNIIQAVGTVTVDPDCESVNGFSGTIQPGSTTSPVPSREMPSPSTVTDDYESSGTIISISSIPLVSGVRTIEQVVISPANNPYGAGLTNAQGVYVIDCQGENLRIRNCRIVATLVLTNVGPSSQVTESVQWEAGVANYPALLVNGSMAFDFTDVPLNETVTNFNPNGTPYEGDADSDLNDSYPSVIRALIYVSANATTTNHPVFDGVVVVGNSLDVYGDVDLAYQGTYLDNPPPGFAVSEKMKISVGSWRQRVD